MDGSSQHYHGQDGADYVQNRQRDQEDPLYGINAQFFAPYLKKSDALLDFGCGNGGMLPHYAKFVASVEAVEINEAARKMAEGYDFKIYPSLSAIGAGMKFDVIVSSHVLEHVPNPCETLRILRGLLAPEGRFIALLPIDDVHSRHQQSWSKGDIDHHLQTWTPRLFANLLFESGFEPVEIRVVTSAWHAKFRRLIPLGLHKPASWALSALMNRRQLFAVARNPLSTLNKPTDSP